MRFGVVTLCTPEMAAVGRLSGPGRRAYCRRHGYDLTEAGRSPAPDRAATWGKLRLLLERLDDYDWLFWNDADSLILRPDLPLTFFTEGPERAGADLLITRDRHGCNAGQFLVSNRHGRARPLLEAVYAQTQFLSDRLADQTALTHAVDAGLSPAVVRYVPKALLNAEIYDVTGESFLIHFLGQPARVYLMRKWLRERPGPNPPPPDAPRAAAPRAAAPRSATGSPAVAEAAAHLRAGRVREAEEACRRELSADPGHPGATHLLGLACRAAGRDDEGFDLLCRSLELAPGEAGFHNNLGTALAACGLADDAADCFRRALALRPGYPAAEANLRRHAAAPPPRRRPAPLPAAPEAPEPPPEWPRPEPPAAMREIRGERVTAGAFSYHDGMRVLRYDRATRLRVGKFCSVARGATFLLGGEHHPRAVTTYPFYALPGGVPGWAEPAGCRSRGDIVVGNDVWVGLGAVVRSGVTIGDGAVVGACAMVAGDVPPYAIVGGVPARVIRYRHTPGQIERLLRVRWWVWDVRKIMESRAERLSEDVEAFLARHDPRPG